MDSVTENTADEATETLSREHCPEEASPEFISEKTLALKNNGNEDNPLDPQNGQLDDKPEGTEQQKNSEDDEVDNKNKQNGASEVIGELKDDKKSEEIPSAEIKVLKDEPLAKPVNSENNVENQEEEEEEEEEEVKDDKISENTESKITEEESNITEEESKITEEESNITGEESKITEEESKITDEESKSSRPIENLVEPISPDHGEELSPEQEEDFQEEHENVEMKVGGDKYDPPAPVITIQPVKFLLS